jgi:Replication-relaxation
MPSTNPYNLILQPRDRRLLAELEVLRIIDREQAQIAAPFQSVTRANTRLLALTRAKILGRTFVGTISGGRKAVYYLPHMNVPGWRDTGFAHQLGINDLHLSLKYQRPAGARFTAWRRFDAPLSQQVRLRPDGLALMATGDRQLALFIEVDCGTEPAKTWEGKLSRYLDLATSGEFWRLFGLPQFRVLVTTSGWTRCRNLAALIGRSTEKIFWLTTMNAARQQGAWADIWLRPNGRPGQVLLPGVGGRALPRANPAGAGEV